MSVVRIAAQAGVSIATVSRVLNNSRRVNPKLVEQVHRAMTELNFSPSQMHRRLSSRRTEQRARTIAIISIGQQYRGWFEVPVLAAVVAEVTRAAQEQHMGTLITEMPDPSSLNPALRRQSVDGALAFIDSAQPAEASDFLSSQMPVVRVMGAQIAPLKIDHVGPDNDAVGYLGCRTLLDRGCRSLGYLTFHPTWDLGKLRSHGFSAGALDAGLRPHSFLLGTPADNLDCLYGTATTIAGETTQLIQHLAKAIQARKDSTPYGLFVSRDEEAVVVQQALAAMGLKAGVDLVLVSCDHELVRLAALHPRPISIDLDAPQIARQAVARLMERIKRPQDPPVRILVRPRIIETGDASAP